MTMSVPWAINVGTASYSPAVGIDITPINWSSPCVGRFQPYSAFPPILPRLRQLVLGLVEFQLYPFFLELSVSFGSD
jgi:hypothetical protein